MFSDAKRSCWTTSSAHGIVAGDSLAWYNDLAADLGGRLIRDQLWFYGNLRDERSKI